MKLALAQLVNSQPALLELSSKALLAAPAFRIARILKMFNSEMALYDQQRTALLEKYGKLNDDKTQYVFDKDNAEKFQNEFNMFLTVEIDINITPISLTDLSDVKIMPQTMLALDWLFDTN